MDYYRDIRRSKSARRTLVALSENIKLIPANRFTFATSSTGRRRSRCLYDRGANDQYSPPTVYFRETFQPVIFPDAKPTTQNTHTFVARALHARCAVDVCMRVCVRGVRTWKKAKRFNRGKDFTRSAHVRYRQRTEKEHPHLEPSPACAFSLSFTSSSSCFIFRSALSARPRVSAAVQPDPTPSNGRSEGSLCQFQCVDLYSRTP